MQASIHEKAQALGDPTAARLGTVTVDAALVPSAAGGAVPAGNSVIGDAYSPCTAGGGGDL